MAVRKRTSAGTARGAKRHSARAATARSLPMYEQDLGRNPANTEPLSPITFLQRSAALYPHGIAIRHGSIARSWAETHRRCRQLASALARAGMRRGDTVAVMAPNIPAHYEAHFGVPMAGAVLNALNIRLDAPTIAFMLDHGQAKVLLTDKARIQFEVCKKAELADECWQGLTQVRAQAALPDCRWALGFFWGVRFWRCRWSALTRN